jgi:hypothetical protein
MYCELGECWKCPEKSYCNRIQDYIEIPIYSEESDEYGRFEIIGFQKEYWDERRR